MLSKTRDNIKMTRKSKTKTNMANITGRKKPRPGNGYVTKVPRGLPSHYPNSVGDEATVNFKFTSIVSIAASTFDTFGNLVFGVGTDSPGISYLSGKSLLFFANQQCYTRWMISDLNVEVRATGVGGNANTFVACSYIPSSTDNDLVPTSLSEVSQAGHYTESSLGTVGRMRVRPCDYFNDWKMCDNADAFAKQVGLLQIYGSGSVTSSGQSAGVITVSGTIHFCGLRR